MTHTYDITGMTCNGCVTKARNELLKSAGITEVTVQLEAPQAVISTHKYVPVETLQAALSKVGNYIIKEADGGMHNAVQADGEISPIKTYKPVFIVFAYITGVTALIETVQGAFVWERWMQNFMAAFFLVFSFFKMLDIKGFAESYFSYDIIAKRWMGWGYVYAFIELALGLAYLVRFNQVITNVTALGIMSLSIIGVLNSVVNKQKIKCACLGTVFSLPMSTVTIIEDALMITMSGIMLVTLL